MCVENQFSVWLHIKKHRYFAQRDVGGGRGTETNKLTFSVCVFYPLFHVWYDSFISVAWLIQTSRHDSNCHSMVTSPLVSVGLCPYLYIVARPQRQSQRIVDDLSRTPRPHRCFTTFEPGFGHFWNYLSWVGFHWHGTIRNTSVVWFIVLSPKIILSCVQTFSANSCSFDVGGHRHVGVTTVDIPSNLGTRNLSYYSDLR